MTTYYEYIDLPHAKEIAEYVQGTVEEFYYKNTIFKIFEPERYRHPLIVEAVEQILPWSAVAHISVITTAAFAHIRNPTTNIHQDIMTLTPWGQEQPVCLNIPIFNCDETYVAIYRQLQDPYKLHGVYKNGEKYAAYHWYPEWCEEIDRMYLPAPALFYTQMPHGIINNTEHSRIILSVRFNVSIDLETFDHPLKLPKHL